MEVLRSRRFGVHVSGLTIRNGRRQRASSGTAGFLTPNKNQFSWQAQQGAVRYQVARTSDRTFTDGCTVFPPTPNNSAGQAIVVPCAP